MKSKTILVMMFVLMLIVAGMSVYAGDGFCKGNGKLMQERFEKIAKELNLTDQQKQQLEEHRKKSMEENAAIHKEMMDKHDELRKELDKSDTNQANVDRIVKELKELHGKRLDSMVTRVQEMKKILTPEQFEKMNKSMEKRREEMKNQMMKKGVRGHHGPGMDFDMP
ncbi:MAG: Spy/CpxP family protein refolding chaperone [Syntrophales bacterium]